MTNKFYNDEIKCLNDLKYRYANIQCRGGYGNNPEVIMLSRESMIYMGYIKDVEVNFIGEENGEKKFNRTLIIDSEYGHEIRLPYEKIIGMDILSSREQAKVEDYNRNKESWKDNIKRFEEMLNNDTTDDMKKLALDMIEVYNYSLNYAEELIANGVKTYK